LHDVGPAYPEVFAPVALPSSPKKFKKHYPSLLVELEQRRCASPKRIAIARDLCRGAAARCFVRDERGHERPLHDLGLDAKPLPIERVSGTAPEGWVPSFLYKGQAWRGKSIAAVVDDLEQHGRTNQASAAVLRRALKRLGSEDSLVLRGERFVVLGAGAELAPTEALLRAGATVLWVDSVPPPKAFEAIGGELHHADGRADLLQRPDEIASTVASFAEAGPAHVSLFAYSAGQGREWRLCAAMNSMLRTLPRSLIASVGMLVSPTTPTLLDQDDAASVENSLLEQRGWRRALLSTRLLRPPRALSSLPRVSDTIVPMQGTSYQAAQWIEKNLAMEVLAD
ncbi:MAG: hypothetical protein AAF658_22690, partial [Myxococcota bacterium]